MADLLYDLLVSAPDPGHSSGPTSLSSPQPPPAAVATDHTSLDYLSKLASQPLSSLDSTEPQSLSHASHALLLSLQSLSKKSHKSIIDSAAHHAALHTTLPQLAAATAELRAAIPRLDNEAVKFSTTYSRSGGNSNSNSSNGSQENDLLARRKRALLLSRNVERLVDMLELPTLLSSAISTQPVNYGSALDLNGHIRRLQALHPASRLVCSVSDQADEAMRTMAANLVLSLRAPSLKLAASLRTIGWLRRILPDITAGAAAAATSGTLHVQGQGKGPAAAAAAAEQEKVLGALFLVCRLAMLMAMLEALAPLRDLADQEKARQKQAQAQAQQQKGSSSAWSGGQQTEKYLKKYIEIFREQSFAIVSMYRSIFPSEAGDKKLHSPPEGRAGPPGSDPLQPMPTPLATFPLHLVDMLLETLRTYLPTVRDQASRDSLLTQVLYCAGSLGRLGGDFGLFLASLDVGAVVGSGETGDEEPHEENEEEWVQVVKRHRLLAGRLESIVGDGKGKG